MGSSEGAQHLAGACRTRHLESHRPGVGCDGQVEAQEVAAVNRSARSDYWEAYATAFPKHTHRCCGKADGETCHVERWFGTLRVRTSRLVRRAYSFSKCPENHFDALHLFITNLDLSLQQKATAR